MIDILITIFVILIVLAALANLLSRLTHPWRVTVLYKDSPHKMRFNTSLFKYTKGYSGDSFEWNQLYPKDKPFKFGANDILAVYLTRRVPFFLTRFTRTAYLDKKDKNK